MTQTNICASLRAKTIFEICVILGRWVKGEKIVVEKEGQLEKVDTAEERAQQEVVGVAVATI